MHVHLSCNPSAVLFEKRCSKLFVFTLTGEMNQVPEPRTQVAFFFPPVFDGTNVFAMDDQQFGAIKDCASEIEDCIHQGLQVMCWLRNRDNSSLK